ncbi:hypothetical protein M9458_043702, partial [Cirrhinus mrigala]
PAGLPAAPVADAENSERAAGADVASAAGVSEPRLASLFRRRVNYPRDCLVEAAEEAAGPSHFTAVPLAETSLEQVCLQPVPETDSLCLGKQTQPDKTESDTTIDDSFNQSQDDFSSQELVDLKLQMDDSDKECEEDAALLENDAMDSEPASGGMTKLYSVQQINNFLDVTKGLRKPKIESYFPDLKVFLLSGTMAMRKASFDELDKPKR